MERLSELLEHVRRVHSPTQIQHFIVTKGGAFCDYGALRQALREVHGRVGVVREKLFRVYELEIDAAALEQLDEYDKDNNCETHFDAQRDGVKMARLLCDLEEVRHQLRERAEELAQFYACACALKDKVERDRGKLTPELHDQLDREMWAHRLGLDAASDLRVSGKVSRGVLDCIAALPASLRSNIPGFSGGGPAKNLMRWASNAQRYTLPKLEAVMTAEEIIDYVADTDRARLGPGEADDTPSGGMLEGGAG